MRPKPHSPLPFIQIQVEHTLEALSHRTSRAVRVVVAMAVLLVCSACAAQPPQTTAAAEALPPRLVTIEVPVTVEVTRETVTERIVNATPQPPEPCAPANLAEAEEVAVGVLLPLSQSSSLATTVAVQSALVLASANLNEAGGVQSTPVVLWWGDTANLPDQGQRRAEEAILQHCVVALIGANNSETATAIDVVAQRYGVPHIIIDGADNSLTAVQSPTLFRLSPNNAMIAAMHADWVAAVGDYNGDGVVTTAIIAESSTYPAAMAEMLRQAFVDAEIVADVYSVDLPSTDFSSLVARIVVKDTLPDVLFVRINSDAGILLLQQLLENGVGPTRNSLIVASRLPGKDDPFWQATGENAAGMISPRVGAWRGMTSEAAQQLVDGFARLYNRWPEGSAFAAHDALLLLADAMRRAPSLGSQELLDALETSDRALAGGHYTFAVTARNRASSDAPAWAWHQWQEVPLLFLQRDADSAVIIWPPEHAAIEGAYLRPGE